MVDYVICCTIFAYLTKKLQDFGQFILFDTEFLVIYLFIVEPMVILLPVTKSNI